MMTVSRRSFGVGVVSATMFSGRSFAQEYPVRPITWVVPSGAGGILDSQARLVGQRVSEYLKQPVIIDTRPGAGGTLGTGQAARMAPDGYSIVMGAQSLMICNPILYPSVTFDPLRDFVPLHGIASTPVLIAANPDRPYKTLRELLEYARVNAGKVTIAQTSVGAASNLVASLVQRLAEVTFAFVPYRSSAQALNDAISGRIDVMFDYSVLLMPQISAGQMRALAFSLPERSTVFPDVPAIGESGLRGGEVMTWTGLFAPATPPPGALRRLSEAFDAALRDPNVRDALQAVGSEPMNLGAEAFAKFFLEEVPRWRELTIRSGARLE